MRCPTCGRLPDEEHCEKCHWVYENVSIKGINGPAGKHTHVVIQYRGRERPTRVERLGS